MPKRDETPNPYFLMMAKSDPDSHDFWLPLWMHLEDTAGVMRMLVNDWVPLSVVRASGLDREAFEKTAVFVAAVHDIGKATSYFQSIVANPRNGALTENGMKILPASEYRFAGKTPHGYAGQWILQSETAGIGVRPDIADVVGAHHGKPISSGDAFSETDLLKAYEINFYGEENSADAKTRWQRIWKRFAEDALKLAGLEDVNQLPELNAQAQVLLSGLLIVADWIASDTDCFPLISKDDLGGREFYPERTEAGCRRVSLPERWGPDTAQYDETLFRARFGFMPNDVQKAVIEAVGSCRDPGVFILEAQMGVGKTEAGLAAAELLATERKAGGIFFGLPTQATSNGLFGRLYAWAGSVSEGTANAIRLAHGAANFNEDYARLTEKGKILVDSEEDSEDKGLSVHPWFSGNKKALLADFVIGTVDQFLMASLKRKHFMLRHLGLAGKVVIIDECHAYDAYMSRYLDRSLEWMAAYGIPVILLSATLPAKRRSELTETYAKAYSRYHMGRKRPQIREQSDGWRSSAGYPLLTWTDGESICQRSIAQDTIHRKISVETVGSKDEIIKKLDGLLSEGGCACIIMNTVREAQDMYDQVSYGLKDVKVILYHAQFIMPDRAEKEQELLRCMGKKSTEKERYRCVLIGTQVLEQSLDYDADVMVSQLCPMDLLLQRIGRLHRHNRVRPQKLAGPTCFILTDGDEPFGQGTEAVYGRYLLLRTWEAMKDRIDLPGDIPLLVQKVYRDPDPEEGSAGMKEAYEEYSRLQGEKQRRAEAYILRRPPGRRGSIEDMLENPDETRESEAECSVRDGTASIEVLLLKRRGNGIVCVNAPMDDGQLFSAEETPDAQAGRKIASQRLRLPHVFCAEWNRSRTMDELEKRNRGELASWQNSPWLRGMNVLLLDEDATTRLAGYRLSYDRGKGLICQREEETGGG